MRPIASALLALSVALAVPRVAAAQMLTGEIPGNDAGDTRSRVAGELGFFYTSGSPETAALMPSVYAALGLFESDEGVFVDLDLAWRSAGVLGEITAFRAMNPYVGMRAGLRDRRAGWRARGGLGVTAPLTNLYDAGAESAAPAVAAAFTQGVFDAWLSLPLNAAVVVRGDFEHRGELFGAGVDGAFAVLLPVEYRGSTGEAIFVGQGGVFALARPVEPLALGLRFQAVVGVGADGRGTDEGCLSLVPFVRGELGGGFVEGRLLMNLDEPLGFAFDPDGYWALSISGGASF